ncbi:enoyl-CoA hydratase/isomerase family protein [uncultured Roseobacter sp.]|uniref:enoyl-CoA hydratase/isomerase family protein n=1 Tax=uncultured Roseobacter sp. TaxID=114847 RepID=UPI0026268BBF|nr:enoyl-CoA hydratase/isomerase family protein [uncultured Roseobacter sp.]
MSAVHLEIAGSVAEIRLENPAKLNALTMSMIEALDAHCARIEDCRDIRSVLLTAAGDRAFCVGADIREWASLDARTFARDWVRRGHRVFDRIARLPVPVIGVLSGHAFGGGLELAATCDLRIAAPGATIALPETTVGIVPGWSGTQRLARQIPPAVLKEMALTGARLSASRAHAVGFLNGVEDDPRSAALEIAERISDSAPQATETAKWLISAALEEDSAAAIEALAGAAMSPTTEKAEGVAAFAEKRRADFGKVQS